MFLFCLWILFVQNLDDLEPSDIESNHEGKCAVVIYDKLVFMCNIFHKCITTNDVINVILHKDASSYSNLYSVQSALVVVDHQYVRENHIRLVNKTYGEVRRQTAWCQFWIRNWSHITTHLVLVGATSSKKPNALMCQIILGKKSAVIWWVHEHRWSICLVPVVVVHWHFCVQFLIHMIVYSYLFYNLCTAVCSLVDFMSENQWTYLYQHDWLSWYENHLPDHIWMNQSMMMMMMMNEVPLSWREVLRLQGHITVHKKCNSQRSVTLMWSEWPSKKPSLQSTVENWMFAVCCTEVLDSDDADKEGMQQSSSPSQRSSSDDRLETQPEPS